MILIYTTHSDEAAAKACCDALLKERLIACANIFPIISMYWWEGTITGEGEVVALMKTSAACWDALERKILEIHPYKTPCIIRMEASANQDYEAWIADQVVLPANRK